MLSHLFNCKCTTPFCTSAAAAVLGLQMAHLQKAQMEPENRSPCAGQRHLSKASLRTAARTVVVGITSYSRERHVKHNREQPSEM